MSVEAPRIRSASSTDLFVATEAGPRQLVRVTVWCPRSAPAGLVAIHAGAQIGSAVVPAGAGLAVIDVPVDTGGRNPGERFDAWAVMSGEPASAFTVTVAEQGWTIHLISHFHVDPVWWNTQAGSITEWSSTVWSGSPQLLFQKAAVDVLRDHVRLAEVDDGYRFVIAEVDYLKPFRDRWPEYRAVLDRLIAEGRVEVVGGTWNEPDTVLPATETLRRNFRYGLSYQRDVLGARVALGWAIDVFGHAPQYPAVAADAGMTGVVLARGGFHQWGLLRDGGFAEAREAPAQHAMDTLWAAPGGHALQLHALPLHYTGGHGLDAADTIEQAELLLLRWFELMRPHAGARQVLLPVGTDLSSPSRWVTELPRLFAQRYVWPRLVCSLPSYALDEIAHAASRTPLDGRAPGLAVTTRDLNPVYTGKDVSYADVKAAHAVTERVTLDAETLLAFSAPEVRARFASAIDRAWRLLVWLSHHDGVTGTHSDQVYVDLCVGWMEAHELASGALDAALESLGAAVDLSGRAGVGVLVANTDGSVRDGLVSFTADVHTLGARGVRLVDGEGARIPMVVEDARRDEQGFLADVDVLATVAAVPGIGHSVLWLVADEVLPEWERDDGLTIRNEAFEVTADPDRNGTLSAFLDIAAGRSLLPPGERGGELVVDLEHRAHPVTGEGPWHLLPTGERSRGGDRAATRIVRERSAVGERLTVEAPMPAAAGALAHHRTRYLLPASRGSLQVRHTLQGQSEDDRLLRVRWPLPVRGSRPIAGVGEAVIGRGHGFTEADAAQHPWTLDSAFTGWIGQGSVARVIVVSEGRRRRHAVGAVEVIVPEGDLEAQRLAGELVLALARCGVTATQTLDGDDRCGDLERDSNLVDARVVLTRRDERGVPSVRALRSRALRVEDGVGWLPADRPLREVWVPSADLRALGSLPVVVICAADGDGTLESAVGQVIDGLDRSQEFCARAWERGCDEDASDVESYTVALASSGVRSGVVEIDGTLWLNLRRSSTGWPAGQWIDPPRRTLPDGSSFSSQHWTHDVEYSVLAGSGDWRAAGIAEGARLAGRPLRARPVTGGGSHPTRRTLVRIRGEAAVEAVHRTQDEGLSVRVSQLGSRPVDVTVDAAVDPVAAHRSTLHDLPGAPLETASGGWSVRVPPVSSAAVLLRPAEHGGLSPARSRAAFSRWWTQNSGPPPADGLPVSAHLRGVGAAQDTRFQEFDLLVVSDLPEATDVDLRFVVPAGTHLRSPSRVTVPPRGHVRERLTLRRAESVRVPSVAVYASPTDARRAPTWDAIHLGPHRTRDLVRISAPLRVQPPDGGGESTLAVEIAWDGSIPVEFEARVCAPFGTWHLFRAPVRRGSIAPVSAARIELPVSAPAAGSRWWALVIVRVLDRVLYSDTVDISAIPTGWDEPRGPSGYHRAL